MVRRKKSPLGISFVIMASFLRGLIQGFPATICIGKARKDLLSVRRRIFEPCVRNFLSISMWRAGFFENVNVEYSVSLR